MNDLSIYNPEALAAARRRAGIEPEALRRWCGAFFRRHLGLEGSLAVLPAETRQAFVSQLRSRFLELTARQESALDRATKLAFRTDDGHVVESVLMETESGRRSLCVSSQIGCACSCVFCATGGLRFVRNLRTEEILDQVMQATPAGSEPPRNVVFMGMGEPLLNPVHVRDAVERLISAQFFALAERRVMVSTCGIPEPMVELMRDLPGIGLAISLHAARQPVRERLMSIASRHPLPELRAALETVCGLAKRDVMLEVLLLDGVNDGPEDAAALVEFARDLPVYVNLLSYNPIPGNDALRPASEDAYRRFTECLETAGHKVTRRYSHGSDIAAACGQLAARHTPTQTTHE
jgi:23S rRNA (adenine2503-C2)-methyltransferase